MPLYRTSRVIHEFVPRLVEVARIARAPYGPSYGLLGWKENCFVLYAETRYQLFTVSCLKYNAVSLLWTIILDRLCIIVGTSPKY